MNTTERKPLAHNYTSEEYQEVVVRSSLWAAAGDALARISHQPEQFEQNQPDN